MDSTKTVLSTMFVWAITLFVPGVVWSLLAAGLYQLIRSSIRRVRVTSPRSQTLAHKPAS